MGAHESAHRYRQDSDSSDDEVDTSMSGLERELHLAVITNDVVRLKQTILNGVDVNCTWQDNAYCLAKKGLTPLFQAVALNYVRIAEVLLHAGANANCRNSEDESVLHKAAFLGREKMLDLLLKSGAKVDSVNQRKETPLHLACKQSCVHSNVNAVLLLLHHGANPNARNVQGATPLHFAGIRGQQLFADALIHNNADPDAVEYTLRTCFYHCVNLIVRPPSPSAFMRREYYRRQLECMKVFIRCGCDTLGFANWLYCNCPMLWRSDDEMQKWMRTAVPESLKHICRVKLQSLLRFNHENLVESSLKVNRLPIPHCLKKYLCREIFL